MRVLNALMCLPNAVLFAFATIGVSGQGAAFNNPKFWWLMFIVLGINFGMNVWVASIPRGFK